MVEHMVLRNKAIFGARTGHKTLKHLFDIISPSIQSLDEVSKEIRKIFAIQNDSGHHVMAAEAEIKALAHTLRTAKVHSHILDVSDDENADESDEDFIGLPVIGEENAYGDGEGENEDFYEDSIASPVCSSTGSSEESEADEKSDIEVFSSDHDSEAS
ncbi:hypothetical protein RUND412_011486, partial [Rhizina undulata]